MIYTSKKSAKEAGAMTYSSGKECPHGHVAERRTASGACVVCMRIDMRERSKRNAQKYRDNAKAWAGANPERKKEYLKKWNQDNYGKRLAYNAERRASRIQAAPPWLTEDDYLTIDIIYDDAQKVGMVVDHIMPLNNPLVCGLHVPWNLQLLTSSANSAKSNKFDGGWN